MCEKIGGEECQDPHFQITTYSRLSYRYNSPMFQTLQVYFPAFDINVYQINVTNGRAEMSVDKTLFNRLGGMPTFKKVHKIFYDKAYSHPWLKQYFTDKPQEVLENQQTDFMVQLMGGPKAYGGKTPKSAHQHMVITEELFDLRAEMLSESIKEAGIEDGLREEWLAADGTLKRALVKTSEKECSQSYPNQPILNFAQ